VIHVSVEGVRVEPNAVGPTLVFVLHLGVDEPVHGVALRTRVVIDSRRRRYDDDEQERLSELFGPREQWRTSLRPVSWADVSTFVGAIEQHGTTEVPVACTYDMEVASTKYLDGVDGRDIPLLFQFSGSTFLRRPLGMQVVQLPHDLEATWSLPASTWRALMDTYFAGARWLRLGPDAFTALCRYKAARALPTWDATVEDLLAR
jgi:hypothetical protein